MAQAKKLDYRTLNEELDTILAQLQDGELDVEAAVKLYERGLEIVTRLEDYLKTAENKVAKLQVHDPKDS